MVVEKIYRDLLKKISKKYEIKLGIFYAMAYAISFNNDFVCACKECGITEEEVSELVEKIRNKIPYPFSYPASLSGWPRIFDIFEEREIDIIMIMLNYHPYEWREEEKDKTTC